MSADLDTNITLRGNKEELFSMLKVLKTFEVEMHEQYCKNHDCGYIDDVEITGPLGKRSMINMSDEDLKTFLLSLENEVNITAMGPWGVFSHPEDIGLFEALAEAAPNACFEGAINGFITGADVGHYGTLEDGLVKLQSYMKSDEDYEDDEDDEDEDDDRFLSKPVYYDPITKKYKKRKK